MTDSPRVLVLSQVIPETRFAGSVVLYRLFQGFSADSLLVAGPRPQADSEILGCQYVELPPRMQRLTRTRLARLLRSLQATNLVPGVQCGAEAQAAIETFEPEVVVTVMQTQAYYKLAYEYARRRGIPLVLIVHDLAEKFEPVYRWAAVPQRRQNAVVYRQAAARLCVSPQMAAHLNQKFGAPGDVLYPNRSEDLTPRAAEESLQLRNAGVLTIGYAGSLAYGYGNQLERMTPAFAAAGARLRLYTSAKPSWANAPTVEWCGFAESPLTTWRRIQAECDAVILPYDWQAADLTDLYQTHFPSKLTEYLALGMPVLVFGPEQATGVRWALEHPAAAVAVTAENPKAWSAALTKVRRSSELRYQLAKQSVVSGLVDFDPVAIRSRFQALLRDLAGATLRQGNSLLPRERLAPGTITKSAKQLNATSAAELSRLP